jgi:pimeloyl-ACP methyl ester carboxylesterase
MGTVRGAGVDLHYVERGEGEQTVVFAHSYLVDHRQFEAQIEALSRRYRVIAYDHRDHGQSGHASAGYAMGDLVRDGVAVIEATGAAPCHWVGLSTGGFVGMRLALWYPELLRRLVLMDTSAQSESRLRRLKYEGMFGVLRLLGPRPLAGEVMRNMFGRTSLAAEDRAELLAQWRERIEAVDGAGMIRFGRAIFGRDVVLDRLGRVETPTLVVVGEEDIATPPALARRIAAAIPGARLEIIERAGHLCTLEEPGAITALLEDFLAAPSGR